MSTFTKWARDEGQGLVEDLNGLLVSVVDCKQRLKAGRIPADEYLAVLTNMQASLLATRTRAGDMTRHLEAALRNREMPENDAPKIDRKQAAAGEGTPAEEALNLYPQTDDE